MNRLLLIALIGLQTQAVRIERLIMVDTEGNPIREADEGFVPTYELSPNHPPKEVVGSPT